MRSNNLVEKMNATKDIGESMKPIACIKSRYDVLSFLRGEPVWISYAGEELRRGDEVYIQIGSERFRARIQKLESSGKEGDRALVVIYPERKHADVIKLIKKQMNGVLRENAVLAMIPNYRPR